MLFGRYCRYLELLSFHFCIDIFFLVKQPLFKPLGPQVKWPQGHPGGAGLPPRAEGAAPRGALCGLVGRGPRG